jgi:hypothetical protein
MKYLNLIPAFLLAAMLTACNTPKKLYEAQAYDQVIQRYAPDICDGDMNANRINYVAASYHRANQADHERIQALKATGQPDVWPEIYQRYCSMKGRNDALKCFPTKVKNGIDYRKLDLDDDLMAARNKAENYLVAKANQLLSTGSKADAMEAETYLAQLARTNRENVNLPTLRRKQAFAMADKVTIAIENESRLPDNLKQAVYAFDEGEVPYVMAYGKASSAMVVVDFDDIDLSPIRHDEVTFKETNGGKTATVTDHTQTKGVTLKGSIVYRDAEGRRLGVVPFEVKSNFKNEYTTVAGDRDACSEETLGRLGGMAVPVPVDESLIMDAGKKLNDLIGQELRK